MSQKFIIGALTILIIGVIGSGIYFALPGDTATPTEVVQNPQVAHTQDIPAQAQIDATPLSQTVTREPQVMAQDTVGDVWDGEGIIILLEDFGFTLELTDGNTVYVELGPPDFWQSQGVILTEGDVVLVNGWNNGEQIHARIVTTTTAQLTLRSESSQPLWAGGADNAQGQGQAGTHDSAQTGQSSYQVAPEDWVTVSGTISAVSNGAITMQTTEGEVYSLQMGQPNFWQSQGVTLSIGDAVEVLGFWMNEQFLVGDITKVATGEHIILRDPNGRQLWGGPGRNGNSNGNGNRNGQ